MEKSKNSNNLVYKVFLGVIGLALLCGLSFYGGIHYQKGKQPTATAQTATAGGAGGGFGGRFGGQRPNFGSVTAVSPTSITIQSSIDGSSKTFSIDSSTLITNSGQSATIADVQTGSNVVIRTSSSTSTTASAILINPSFGSGASNPANSGTSTN